jgi:O-antigen/teichoic acid export membrane protein
VRRTAGAHRAPGRASGRRRAGRAGLGSRLSRSTRGGLVLGVASALSNALGYAFTVVLARSFGPADYGALVALLGAGLIGTIPASGLQYVVARRTVALGFDRDRNDGATLLLAAVAGVALLVVAAAVAPLARSYLHLSGVGPVLALGAALVPLTLAGAVQGGLLGHGRFTALGTVYVVAAAGRFAGGALTAAAGWNVTGAMATLAVAAVLTTGFSWLLAGPRSWRPVAGRLRLRAERALAGDVARACSAVAGIIVLTNVDVLLARHYLDRETSGAYAVASLFAKALLWGSQFVAQAAYPALARPEGRRRLLGLTLAGTGGIGLVGVGLTAVAAGPVVRAVTGQGDYGPAARLAPLFALLGLGWTLAQALLLAAVAAGDRRPGRLLWAAIAVEAGVVALALHRSPGQILAACLVTVTVYIAAVAVLDRLPARAAAVPQTAQPAQQPGEWSVGDVL